jgi:hypothetical protein
MNSKRSPIRFYNMQRSIFFLINNKPIIFLNYIIFVLGFKYILDLNFPIIFP